MQNPVSLPVHNTPFCGDLRSKKFFLLDGLAREESDYLDDSNHTWCYHTQQVIGPDGNIVMPSRCVPGRHCYHSALANPNALKTQEVS